ncbi:hypothetical protein Angca_006640 [Angiostrongylus cantonensis]|uniref:BZIP domain-containing protein n=1 Tax=Angiostrongylus cantonensis TaxID=6313 RepID=A0A0K0CZY7_ANGCA|nr:hypothetical protein Angca_006640 [Angiostrongylus cantonensis]
MLPVFAPSTFDAHPFQYNPYGYSVPFSTTYANPGTENPEACSAIGRYYQDAVYVKPSTPSCSKSESDISSDEAYRRKREKRDRNNEAARTSRLRRKARETQAVKEAELLQKENQSLKDEVDELKKVLYSLQDELSGRMISEMENVVPFQNISCSFRSHNL